MNIGQSTSTAATSTRKRKHLGNNKKKSKFAKRAAKKTKLSFTYFPHGKRKITAIKITERPIKSSYIFTIYCCDTETALAFHDKECINKLGRHVADRITNSNNRHSNSLHKPEEPLEAHVHFEVDKGEEKTFIRNLVEQHISNIRTEHFFAQFFKSFNFFTSSPESPGVKFSDGGCSENRECKNILESITMLDSNFEDGEQLPDLQSS